ncbi:hypothetical protein Droror1_Dr00027406 [Drosera rotundifolia]
MTEQRRGSKINERQVQAAQPLSSLGMAFPDLYIDNYTQSLLFLSHFMGDVHQRALVVAGSDDIANTYFDTPFRRRDYDVNSYTDLMSNSASSFIQDLYKLGIRRMGVFSAPPIGCVPSQRTIGGGVHRVYPENYNEAAKLLNSKLSSALDTLSTRLLSSRPVYIDIYNPLLDLIQNPSNYDTHTHMCIRFQIVDIGCCGTGLLEVTILCNQMDNVCSNYTKYVFWDSYHPIEAGYQIAKNYISSLI